MNYLSISKMMPKILTDDKKHMVGMELDEDTFFHNLYSYELGPESYASSAVDFLEKLRASSLETIADYSEGVGYVIGFRDGVGDELDSDPSIGHRINHMIDDIFGEPHDGLDSEIRDQKDSYQLRINTITTMLKRLSGGKEYFRKHINDDRLNPQTVEYFNRGIQLMDEIILNYKFVVDLADMSVDKLDILYQDLEDHLS